jgi:hypothetical protein
VTSEFSHEVQDALEPWFDRAYYLACHPDVARAGIDPLYHFHLAGWREGRNPSKQFDCSFYLKTYQDVAAANINPLLHFVWSGKGEGRLPRRPLDDERRILEAFEPLAMRARHWEAAADNTDPLAFRDLMAALCNRKPLARVIAISHDDYLTSFGGVQNVMRDELRTFEAAGWDYVHVMPAAPLPMLAPEELPQLLPVRVRIGRDYFGVVTTSTLAAALAELRAEGLPVFTVVHHLMGYSPEAVALLIGEGKRQAPIVWLHDYFTHCPSYALMRNDLKFCGGPPVGAAACRLCGYGSDRRAHVRRMSDFFSRFRPHVIAPSAAALGVWRSAGKLPHAVAHVIPIASLTMNVGGAVSQSVDEQSVLRVAFLGARVHHKGWVSFEDLAQSFKDDKRYQFFQFGADKGEPLSGAIHNVPVTVTERHPTAMIDALRAYAIDVAIIFPLWPETFNYTVHEALAAGAFVITGPNSGNVWPAVTLNAPGRGHCFDTMASVKTAFRSGQIRTLVADVRVLNGTLKQGQGIAGLLLADAAQVEQEDVRGVGVA